MSIAWSMERWETVKDNYRRWWAGELERPLIQVTLGGHDPGRPEPELPHHGFWSNYAESVSAEAIIDRMDYDLSSAIYLGDAFPQVHPNFGPGVLAAFIGGQLKNAEDGSTAWFLPAEPQEIDAVHFKYFPDAYWLTRIKNIYRAGISRWQGLVQIGMSDLGGNLDILSTFRPGQELLLDLYDHPAEVERLVWEAHELWWRSFSEFNEILQPLNPGYTAWTPIYSEKPYYMLQCDFCYMISPEMFDKFVKPEIAACCRRLGNPFYHLDGPGQLPHLDSLLTIPELKGIQWIPGAGQPGVDGWPEVYRKIRAAGKLIQTFGSLAEFERLVEQLGSAQGIIHIGWGGEDDQTEIEAKLAKFGCL